MQPCLLIDSKDDGRMLNLLQGDFMDSVSLRGERAAMKDGFLCAPQALTT